MKHNFVNTYRPNHIGIEIGKVIDQNNNIYENNFNASDLERQIKYSADVYYKDITVSGSSPTVFERINLFIRDLIKILKMN